ncbi:MAG: hypothetical protein VB099_20085 [Candidatus Limiplasma sp.]|nr:hypothetical protein [Candidatus Limiplasma sp.]
MADYQAMYILLFRKMTAVIEELQNVQQQAEEMYRSSEPLDIRVIGGGDGKEKKPDGKKKRRMRRP